MVETLGQAHSYGWRVTARCAAGKQDGMVRHKECVYRAELDMETLVWTTETRLRCPMCGSRNVVLMFVVPSERQSNRIAKRSTSTNRYTVRRHAQRQKRRQAGKIPRKPYPHGELRIASQSKTMRDAGGPQSTAWTGPPRLFRFRCSEIVWSSGGN
jgi:hypothetical protein